MSVCQLARIVVFFCYFLQWKVCDESVQMSWPWACLIRDIDKCYGKARCLLWCLVSPWKIELTSIEGSASKVRLLELGTSKMRGVWQVLIKLSLVFGEISWECYMCIHLQVCTMTKVCDGSLRTAIPCAITRIFGSCNLMHMLCNVGYMPQIASGCINTQSILVCRHFVLRKSSPLCYVQSNCKDLKWWHWDVCPALYSTARRRNYP